MFTTAERSDRYASVAARGGTYRAGIHPDRWPTALDEFEQRFGHAVGSATHLADFLARVAQQTLHGMRACRDVFT